MTSQWLTTYIQYVQTYHYYQGQKSQRNEAPEHPLWKWPEVV